MSTIARRSSRPLRITLVTIAAIVLALLSVVASALAADRFDDDISGSHRAGVSFVAETGVTAGCDADNYCPRDPVTREQMATFMHRLAGHADGVAPSVDAATVGGLTPEQLTGGEVDLTPVLDRLDRLEATVGALQSDVSSLEQQLSSSEAANDALQGQITTLQGQVTTLQGRVDDLEADQTTLDATLAGVSRAGDTLLFEGMNLQIVNGQGQTNTTNGVGNLIVGYNEPPEGDWARSGSHMLVLGTKNDWTSFGGLVAGSGNLAGGAYASISGGENNVASGWGASISGGRGGLASNITASILGGQDNTASGINATVSGGRANRAIGGNSSVLGSVENTVSANGIYPPAP